MTKNTSPAEVGHDAPVQEQKQQKAQTSLADVTRLRAQRMTIHTQSDLDRFTETSQEIAADLEAFPGKPGSSIVGAVAVALVVVVSAAILAFIMFGLGASMMESFTSES